nr:carboxypeptidase-like regulatory domain-containing protein [Bacteroidales bacterium]
MKKLFFLLALLLSAPVWGQPVGFNIRSGAATRDRAFPILLSVADSLTGEPVSFASVYLKPVKDTIITNFTLSDAKGRVILDRVVRGEYNLNVEMLGYKPYRKKYYFTESQSLGKILLQEDARMLEAAKVTAAVAPIEIKGDTVVYNAAAYTVAENDVLKDLLKQMTGIEVGEDGSVKVQGESVNQITVNGRTFFMGDKRAALDNLPAKAVERIKVTDHENETESVTGIRKNSASRTRDMDVSLKQEYKKGTFGNVQASAGASLPSKEQDEMLASVPFLWNTSGMLSAFGEKDQVTLIGRGENVDNGSRIMARRSGGLTTGGQAGVNYTTDRIKKLDSGVSVYYNGSSKENAQRSSTEEYPLSGDTVQSERTSSSQNTDHRITASVSLRSNSRRSKGFLFSFEPRFTFQDGRSSSLSASSSQLNG